MYALETSQLMHRYSANETVTDQINLQVPTGSIYGFLGPNGAGKTTTLRLILGLLKVQTGAIAVFGKSFARHRVEILKSVGSMIESPSLYDHLNAEENLALLQKVYRCPKARIQTVLELTGIADTGNKKISQFSLGMKQRLGIAVALLHSPDLLILDEPTNGLDPNGIIEIRELLKKLNRESGITIVISSHLLAEIEKLVTHIGIIHKGKMMFQGTMAELKSRQEQVLSISLCTSDDDRALEILQGHHVSASIDNEKLLLPAIPRELLAMLNKQLVANDIDVYEIAVNKNDLESIFMELIE
jgi:lantibiotic transport system ATP-binding protein